MIVKEYRIVMPLTVEEYQIGQLYSTAMASKEETGGGEGVEVIRNEFFDNISLMGGKYREGQYTEKIYHISSRLPKFLRLLLPSDLQIMENAWNAYPYCKTIVTNPGFMNDTFQITLESLHLPGKGEVENALELPAQMLTHREVIRIDIANDPYLESDFRDSEDPSRFRAACGREPLRGHWIETANPVMTAYKVVIAEFKWFGLQTRVENLIQSTEQRLFTKFHRQIFCWMDRWHGMSLQEIHELEERIRVELNEARRHGNIHGMQIEHA